MFIQCILPDESERIRQSAVMTMLDLFLILSVFNSETKTEDIEKHHPKIGVVFNHVSKFEDPAEATKRIQKYKQLLVNKACEIYCTQISD